MKELFTKLNELPRARKKLLLMTIVESSFQKLSDIKGGKILIGENDYYSSIDQQSLTEALLEQGKKYQLEDSIELVEFTVGEEKVKVLLEAYLPSTRLIILGCGHIAHALAKISEGLNLELVVIDDRPYFANQERFPQAKEVICNDFITALEALNLHSEDFVVIATRGHRHDLECLKFVLAKETAYVGMIGSKRRIKKMFSNLVEGGFAQERLEQVYTPIGLDIGAQTPWEIAISILAEIIQVYRRVVEIAVDQVASQELIERIGEELGKEDNSYGMALVTIAKTKGSTPRKAGAKMLILADGRSFGTIGGGCSEAEVKQKAVDLIKNQAERVFLYRVDMTAELAADEGMVCGGVMDVVIEIIN
ncbi:xanthine dehydrogenase accessory factor [Orenia metallireducens]|uniref:Xanthine dehydrogenase accessory factor n=1 Tax=Orenia metallireducens TaxID=1413210 RepID=A0A285GJL4_9FIRM|nr:XdhC/CoxI family protein [Orenia metallireducens]SNY22551.1 xanthine dehydrogenase accessory factor [Orenia metallireducens]